jgi:phosphohistidine phosphatase SixA
MKPRPALLGIALTLLLVPLSFARRAPQEPLAPQPHTVILVRHAEKDTSGDPKDPGLTAAGEERARALARLLGHASVARLVASEFRRTQATLAPLAAATKLSVETRPAMDLDGLAAELLRAPPGSLTVVAGHSNTLPALAEKLGAPLAGFDPGENLADSEYDRLFVLTVGGSSVPAPNAKPARGLALELRYGAP